MAALPYFFPQIPTGGSVRQFYLQDSRTYLGNCMVWWRQGYEGYTTNLNEALVIDAELAQAMHYRRPTDVPWPKEYIDERVRPTVDTNLCQQSDALVDTGLDIRSVPKVKKLSNCHHCGAFMNEAQRYMCGCPKCGEHL
jgi:hypothetical protein